MKTMKSFHNNNESLELFQTELGYVIVKKNKREILFKIKFNSFDDANKEWDNLVYEV